MEQQYQSLLEFSFGLSKKGSGQTLISQLEHLTNLSQEFYSFFLEEITECQGQMNICKTDLKLLEEVSFFICKISFFYSKATR